MLRNVKNKMILVYRTGSNNLKVTSSSGYKLSNNQVNQVFLNSIMGVSSQRNFRIGNSNPHKTDEVIAPKKRKPRTPEDLVAKVAEPKSEVAPNVFY